MSAFDPYYSYWHFVKTVQTERRWVFTGKAKKFLTAVGEASKAPNAAKLAHRFVYIMKKVRYDFEAVPNYGIYRKKKNQAAGEYINQLHTESPP